MSSNSNTISEIIKNLSKPLSINEIEFRVQSTSLGAKKGQEPRKAFVNILVYKDARVDMQRLDDVVGPLNWKREHSRDNKNCTVSIWDDEKKQWVSKEDTGTESNTEKEKGLASDSYKRSCVNWGIGRELYGYPRIFFQLFPDEFTIDNRNNKESAKTNYNFDLKEWSWDLDVDEDTGVVNKLVATDSKNRIRYDSNDKWVGFISSKDKKSQSVKPEEVNPTPPKQGEKTKRQNKPKLKKETYEKALKSTKIDVLTQSLTKYNLDSEQIIGISKRIEELKKKNESNA